MKCVYAVDVSQLQLECGGVWATKCVSEIDSDCCLAAALVRGHCQEVDLAGCVAVVVVE